jgi:hypothetical protein
MRFFRKSPDQDPAPRRTPHPWNPPQTELPAVVPISTLQFDPSEQAAVAVTGLSAYTRGFEIFVTRLIRPGVAGLDQDPVPGPRRAVPAGPRPFAAGPQAFQISVRFSDGRTLTSGRPRGDIGTPEPFLQSRGGGGTSHYQLLRWWAWPLPPSGPLEFSCEWPAYGITGRRVSIDAQLILDAARQSVRLWPDDES